MKKLSRIILLPILAALMLLPIGLSNAKAGRPARVKIAVDEYDFGPTPEPFNAWGNAVSEGLICPSGTVADIQNRAFGPEDRPFRLIYSRKHFDCADGSGTFDVVMRVRLDLTTFETTARWRVVSGTGDYSRLRARGFLKGTPIVPGSSIHDDYYGRVH